MGHNWGPARVDLIERPLIILFVPAKGSCWFRDCEVLSSFKFGFFLLKEQTLKMSNSEFNEFEIEVLSVSIMNMLVLVSIR